MLYTSTVTQDTDLLSLRPVAPVLAIMADWVVATEMRNLAVGMGLRVGIHAGAENGTFTK